MGTSDIVEQIKSGMFDERFRYLYGSEDAVKYNKNRYLKCIDDFYKVFGQGGELVLLSVPGRSEVGGNHTDHNHGRVLACAIDLDIIAVVRISDREVVKIKSEGFAIDIIELDSLGPVAVEQYKSPALVRGVCARLKELGYKIGGFEAYTSSCVLKGSGLSSSAAFEVMVANIISRLYNESFIDPVVMAQAAQFAECDYFGKPCGLMDQTACAVGGFITIDFADTQKPIIEKLDFDFAKTGHTLCIVDTAGNHSDLNEDYASIQGEMKLVAQLLGNEFLRECDEETFYKKIAELREKAGDRAVLRAIHFFGDNSRVVQQTQALRSDNFELFKKLIIESGRSSFMYLQNIYSIKNAREQGVSLALAISERLLGSAGAWRVHGGGFAGTIQAFVPSEKLKEYVKEMNEIFGEKACYLLMVRQAGAYAFN